MSYLNKIKCKSHLQIVYYLILALVLTPLHSGDMPVRPSHALQRNSSAHQECQWGRRKMAPSCPAAAAPLAFIPILKDKHPVALHQPS